MHDLVQEVISMCEFQTTGREVRLLQNISFENVIEINSDRKRIKQILVNLMTNSIKFTQRGSVTITVKLEEIEQLH